MNSLNLPYKPADIPDVSGVYLFYGNSGQILYVGKAKILRERLRSYLTPDNAKTGNLMALSKTVSYIPVDNEIDALILEANLIKKHQPRFNVNFKDGKNYPFIKITLSEKYPKLYTARKVDKSSKDLYFGPYPTGLDLKFIMRYIRRIFPFCTHRKPYSSCLYFHLGLCPGPEFKVDKKTYFQNIKKIVLFLSGDKSKVINLLNKDLKSEIRAQRFENAKIIYGQIKKLENFATFRQSPEDYLQNNSALTGLRQAENKELINVLQKNGVQIDKIETIEGYDISNISGKEASASLVLFKNGQPDKKGYRHFKIKTLGPNDYLMLKETLARRLKNSWPLPDLFLIDGGFGQLNAVLEVLRINQCRTPAISLAKRLEHICLPNQKEIVLSYNSPALHLLQRVRDESHRFARRYHHLLRSRILKS